MNATKKKYASKCKQKVVTFYKCDAELLAFAYTINFQLFVKQMLTLCMQMDKKDHKAVMEKWGKQQ